MGVHSYSESDIFTKSYYIKKSDLSVRGRAVLSQGQNVQEIGQFNKWQGLRERKKDISYRDNLR